MIATLCIKFTPLYIKFGTLCIKLATLCIIIGNSVFRIKNRFQNTISIVNKYKIKIHKNIFDFILGYLNNGYLCVAIMY